MAKTTSKAGSKAGQGKGDRGKGGAGNSAFMKPVKPDDALAKIVGAEPLPRTELTKKLWEYIKKNGLQDAKERRQINADDNLKKVFGGKSRVNMFEMTKLVNQHISA
jgi:upstream activation factor subunit UAF30